MGLLDYFLTDKATIKGGYEIVTDPDTGIISQTQKDTQTEIECCVFPVSQKEIYEEAGNNIDAQYRLFCYPNDAIQDGISILWNGDEYRVTTIIKWSYYTILYLKKVS